MRNPPSNGFTHNPNFLSLKFPFSFSPRRFVCALVISVCLFPPSFVLRFSYRRSIEGESSNSFNLRIFFVVFWIHNFQSGLFGVLSSDLSANQNALGNSVWFQRKTEKMKKKQKEPYIYINNLYRGLIWVSNCLRWLGAAELIVRY